MTKKTADIQDWPSARLVALHGKATVFVPMCDTDPKDEGHAQAATLLGVNSHNMVIVGIPGESAQDGTYKDIFNVHYSRVFTSEADAKSDASGAFVICPVVKRAQESQHLSY